MMTFRRAASAVILLGGLGALVLLYGTAVAQLIDRTLAPNALNEGIAKSLSDEVGAGRGDVVTPGSSAFVIARDPFRAIRRGRQLFQRLKVRDRWRATARAMSAACPPLARAWSTAAPGATGVREDPRDRVAMS
jgi:hypothetical protein